MNTTRFFHAYTPAGPGGALRPIQLIVRDGLIQAVSYEEAPLQAQRQVDCGGQVLLPGFVDSHLHLPGSFLYQRHGIDLMDCASAADCRRALEAHSGAGTVLRGFGWNQMIFQDDPQALPGLQAFLNRTFPVVPVALFSDDYHSCIINRALLNAVSGQLPQGYWDGETGLLRERAVFALLRSFPALTFRREEIADTLLAFQGFLLSRGIVAVQTLMPIGMTENVCFDILQELETQGLWKLYVNFAVTAHPEDDLQNILSRYRALEARQSPLIRLHTVKLYIDGVLDNKSAFLAAPYEGEDACGAPIWEDGALEAFCTLFDRENIQIHAHVIGDAAAGQIVRALRAAMDANGRGRNKNRHTLAHLQMVREEDRRAIGRLGLGCAFQPFWFPQNRSYPVDLLRIGRRAEQVYPCADLLRRGGGVSFGSDSPVTPDPAPLAGMACAMGRSCREQRLSFQEALSAYTASGAWQLFQEEEFGRVAPGFRADFALVRAPEGLERPEAVRASAVVQTYLGGEAVWSGELS